MYDYWCAWRKAYHNARITYHGQMVAYYESQRSMMESMVQMWLDGWKLLTTMGTSFAGNQLVNKYNFWK